MNKELLHKILELAATKKASDVHFKAGQCPTLRILGDLKPLRKLNKLTLDDLERLASVLMTLRHKKEFSLNHHVDMAYSVPGFGRFRVNIFRQRGTFYVIFRVVPTAVETFEELHLPNVLEKISMEARGLVLTTGMTGSGKTTTLASIIDYINMHRNCNIISIEDPIEYLHTDKKCFISQREIGTDVNSFKDAMRSVLRQDPDVILVGEMRDMDTMEMALHAAETGHLVLSTLHTLDATESINRILSVFPPHQYQMLRNQLATVLKAVVSQRLIPRKDGEGMVPAVEILVSTGLMKECIIDEERTREIPDVIAKGYTSYGMQTFDQSLLYLLKDDLISYDEALRQATNPSDFKLKVRGIESASDAQWKDYETGKIEDNEKR